MKNFKILLALFIVMLGGNLFAEMGGMSRGQYIDMWKDEAIYQMTVHKIPASITLAQGMLESGNGNSTLATNANNHFGIKCHSSWDGAKVYHDDDAKGECFRKYPNARHSYEDHSIFLKQKRYLGLYDLKTSDYKGWAKGLKKAGYATDPAYAKRLISLIEENDLTQYDDEGLKLLKKGEIYSKGGSSEGEENEIDITRPDLDPVETDEVLPAIAISNNRSIRLTSNDVPYIIVEEGDSFDRIALDLDLMPWQLWRYNDMGRKDALTPGMKLYTKPKRNNAKKDFHIVAEDETMWDISYKYAVKLNKLYKKNRMTSDDELTPGTKISLRRRL